MKGQIRDGRFELLVDGAQEFREEQENSGNIKTYAEFMKDGWPNRLQQIEALRKAGKSESEIEKALFVLVFPSKKIGSGTFVAVTKPDLQKELLELVNARKAKEQQVREQEENRVSIRISSRGWGDYAALTWSGDRRKPALEILAEMKALIAGTDDLDESPTEEELLGSIESAKRQKLVKAEKDLSQLSKQIASVKNPAELPSEQEARARMRRYNDVVNEGGDGYVPHVVSKEEFDSWKVRREELETIIATEREFCNQMTNPKPTYAPQAADNDYPLSSEQPCEIIYKSDTAKVQCYGTPHGDVTVVSGSGKVELGSVQGHLQVGDEKGEGLTLICSAKEVRGNLDAHWQSNVDVGEVHDIICACEASTVWVGKAHSHVNAYNSSEVLTAKVTGNAKAYGKSRLFAGLVDGEAHSSGYAQLEVGSLAGDVRLYQNASAKVGILEGKAHPRLPKKDAQVQVGVGHLSSATLELMTKTGHNNAAEQRPLSKRP